ncbi:MAG: hypothetical protein MdMp014T_2826 [Treponematales bacterium]
MSTGEDLDFLSDEADEAILGIKASKPAVKGPYCVVYKSVQERFVIVALDDWRGEPRLGIRWIWDNIGLPISSRKPTWFVLPESL